MPGEIMEEEADRGSFNFSNIGYNNNNSSLGQNSLQGAYSYEHSYNSEPLPVAYSYQYPPPSYPPRQQLHGYPQLGVAGYPPSHGANPAPQQQHGYPPPPQLGAGSYHGGYPIQGYPGWSALHHGGYGSSHIHGGVHTKMGWLAGGVAIGAAAYRAYRRYREHHEHGGGYDASCHGSGHHGKFKDGHCHQGKFKHGHCHHSKWRVQS